MITFKHVDRKEFNKGIIKGEMTVDYNTGEFYSTYGKLENIDFQITLYEYLEDLKIELV